MDPQRRAVERVNPNDVSVQGSMAPELIAHVFKSNRRQVLYCYESSLLTTPNLAGRVALQWVIGSDGKVSKIWVESSTLPDKKLEACLTERIKTWQFPKPKAAGDVTVTYRFQFAQVQP